MAEEDAEPGTTPILLTEPAASSGFSSEDEEESEFGKATGLSIGSQI